VGKPDLVRAAAVVFPLPALQNRLNKNLDGRKRQDLLHEPSLPAEKTKD
jgi:hypothetical protein